ncbi:MAG: hypothetical protein CMD92_04300 [Gammaproteobacteria bacterium]|nr:hypothetical protein [Gammaproteobacteria bacterium]HBW83520.1 hypothetical protein [Gammaproteobacteria bacterium]
MAAISGASILHLFANLEETSLSILLRESGVAFFSSLTLHSLAMAFVVGVNLALAFSLLGLTPSLLNKRFQPFFILHWWAVLLIFFSGLALLVAYPAKALTNPVFYLKFTALTIGLLITWRLQCLVRDQKIDHSRPGNRIHSNIPIAFAMLCCWMLTIGAGRFLAYTHSVLLASRYF